MTGEFEKLVTHIGHQIVCVYYGEVRSPDNVAIECETCNEVLVDADSPRYDESIERAATAMRLVKRLVKLLKKLHYVEEPAKDCPYCRAIARAERLIKKLE